MIIVEIQCPKSKKKEQDVLFTGKNNKYELLISIAYKGSIQIFQLMKDKIGKITDYIL